MRRLAMQYAEKTLYIFLTIALIGIGGLFLSTFFPIPGNIEIKIVQSGSMEPAISTGAIVIVKPFASYAVGDIVTFGKDTVYDVPTTHRIVGVGESRGETIFETKGDANEDKDHDNVRENDVIGRVVASVPYAGYILDFARKPMGFIALIIIPALMVIWGEGEKIVKEVIRMKRGSPL